MSNTNLNYLIIEEPTIVEYLETLNAKSIPDFLNKLNDLPEKSQRCLCEKYPHLLSYISDPSEELESVVKEKIILLNAEKEEEAFLRAEELYNKTFSSTLYSQHSNLCLSGFLSGCTTIRFFVNGNYLREFISEIGRSNQDARKLRLKESSYGEFLELTSHFEDDNQLALLVTDEVRKNLGLPIQKAIEGSFKMKYRNSIDSIIRFQFDTELGKVEFISTSLGWVFKGLISQYVGDVPNIFKGQLENEKVWLEFKNSFESSYQYYILASNLLHELWEMVEYNPNNEKIKKLYDLANNQIKLGNYILDWTN